MKNHTTILLLFGCIGLLSPKAFGVLPPPDGGYPGGNTAEGQNALLSLTTGGFNTAVGFLSLRSNTEGGFNTGVGAGALLANNSGRNTAIGAGALLSNTTGPANTANGAFALLSNTQGGYNTAVGDRALQSHTAGDRNTAIGASALLNDTTGTNNTAIGAAALLNNATGRYNTAIGDDALGANATGESNTAIGRAALLSNMIGPLNTAIGGNALLNNTTGDSNTATGHGALSQNTTGRSNIALGAGAGVNVHTADDVICIGAPGEDISGSCYIGNIFDATSPGGGAVFVNSDGRLGITTSSQRFKKKIRPMGEASDALFALKPVSFHYKKEIDPRSGLQFGLVAEEVEKVNPNLVVRDKEGKPYSVRYDQVNAMLLNEFLKEHRKVQQLEANAGRQQQQIDVLSAGLQKVSAQLAEASPFRGGLEMSKAVPQLASLPRRSLCESEDNR